MPLPSTVEFHRKGALARRAKQGTRRAKQVARRAAALRWIPHYLAMGKRVPKKLLKMAEVA